jgi:hypothetical protein
LFFRGVDNVERIARENSLVILFAETLSWKCHRRFIALELQNRGWETIHIIEKDKFWSPKNNGFGPFSALNGQFWSKASGNLIFPQVES